MIGIGGRRQCHKRCGMGLLSALGARFFANEELLFGCGGDPSSKQSVAKEP